MWFDRENLIVGGSTDLGGDSNTIIKIVIGPNAIPQNWFVKWELPSLINTIQVIFCLMSNSLIYSKNV